MSKKQLPDGSDSPQSRTHYSWIVRERYDVPFGTAQSDSINIVQYLEFGLAKTGARVTRLDRKLLTRRRRYRCSTHHRTPLSDFRQ